MTTPSEQDPRPDQTGADRPAPRFGQYAPSGWQAPGGEQGTPPPPAPAPAPGWGGAPGWGAQQPLGYQQQRPGQPPMAPPSPFRPMAVQPGIVPLRPLSVWEIIDGAFRAVRHNPKVMFGVTVIGVAISVLISAVITWYASPFTTDLVRGLYDGLSPAEADELASLIGPAYATVFSLPVSLVFTQIITGVLIRSVSQSVLGTVVEPGEVVRGQGGRLARVVGFAALSMVVTLLVGVLLIALVVVTSMSSAGAGVALALLGGLAFLAAALWVSVRTLLVPAGLMLEGGRFWPTVARSWRLTRGGFWRLTGLYLLVMIASAVVAGIVSVPFGLIAALVTQDATMTGFGAVAITSVGDVIATTLTTVFAAGAYALAYIDARMRKEGLDVELARAASQD
ncbi:hypothetical protein [Cellulomonas sp. RIT-PI-Y]|uniref:hypothetical protein n=1 Tax=Cellulomonas sp. RIT-PI-Y TaxID=3035297 RepID=UPI0021DA171A|nr:hypothetical protein [Cellulomonas sp. RIT-PI-Y]